jgi:hypothetical protein
MDNDINFLDNSFMKDAYENTLYVISNHPPEKWSDEQKAGIPNIDYTPMPNIPASYSSMEVHKEFINPHIDRLEKMRRKAKSAGKILHISIQGEWTFVGNIVRYFADKIRIQFWTPTTERVVKEVQNPDSSITKVSEFRFVRWRRMA